MPKIESGEAGTATQGPKGTIHVQFDAVDDMVLEGREGRPNALRVRFVGEHGERISLGAPLTMAARNKLSPFIDVPESLPYSAEGLLSFIKKSFPKGDWWWVEVYNGWVTSIDHKDHDSLAKVWCEPGTHRGYLHRVYKFYRADNAPRVSFEFLSQEGRFASFTAPWPSKPKELITRQGVTPQDDYIGPPEALNPGVTLWKYLCQFGLKWDQFLQELNDAPVLYSYLGIDGNVKGYFSNDEDITPDLTDIVKRHGPQLVQWEMVISPQYGLGMQRGSTHLVEFLPVLMDKDGFKTDVAVTLALWDQLASAIMGKQIAMTNPDGGITDDGKAIVNGLWRPVVNLWPAVSLKTRPDGLPGITFPMTAATWRQDGVVALGFMAERLIKLPEEDLVNPAGLCSLHDNTKIGPWVAEHVPEFKMISTEEEEVM